MFSQEYYFRVSANHGPAMNNFKFLILSVLLASLFPQALTGQVSSARRMTPVYTSAAREHDSILATKVPIITFSGTDRARQLPAVVDNSRKKYWPGILDQYMFYSCQQYAGVAYVFGYEINRLRDQTGWYWENSYPTHYTWNFMNQGDRFVGVNFLQSFEVIKQQGQMASNDYGMDTATSVLGWITGYDKYYRGMFNHLKQVSAIKINNAAGINTLRNYLYDHLNGSPTGGIACFTTSSGTLYNMPLLPTGTTEAGKSVILAWQTDPVHGLTVVGYNDLIRYDINHDGRYTNNKDITGDGIIDARDWEIGGFKIANSYGNWWADTGYVYALYRSFALNYGEGGVWNDRVYVVDADTAYRPLLTMKVNLNYSARNRIRILAGVSQDTLNQFPDHVIDFPVFNFQGGEHAMQGNDTIPAEKSIEFGLDVTPLLNFVSSGQPARFFMMVEERDPENLGQGRIEHVSFISYYNGSLEIPVKSTDVLVKDNSTTFVSVVGSFGKPGVSIVTSSLPPYTASQQMQVQLQATGGRPPYDWSFAEEYLKKPTRTPEPLITGTSIIVPSDTRSFASIALPFKFPFFGKRFDSIFVNYFGFISFEPQNLPAPYTTDETGMLRMFPLVVPSFSQQYVYQSSKNDGIWFQADTTHAIIRWKASVAGHVFTSTNDFSIILYPDGRFEFCYGTMENLGFAHTFYKGVSKGDELNFDIQTQWDANELSGQSILFYPPVLPENFNLSKAGLLSVDKADSTVIYNLHVRATDAGKISDSKELMLSSGLQIVEEIICGDDNRLKSGKLASMKLILKNNGLQPIQNLVIKLHPADSLLKITDSLYSVPLLGAGQSLTIPAAFSFSLRHPLPNGFPVLMTMQAQSTGRSWNKDLVCYVAAAELAVESHYVVDGYNNLLDPGEVADLFVTVKNSGGIMAKNLRLKLVSSAPEVTILSDPQITIANLDVFSSDEFHFQISASRNTLPGSDIPMQILLSDSSGALQTVEFNLRIGTRLIALVNLSSSPASVTAMANALDSLHVGYDQLSNLFFDCNRYASIFLILGTSGSGSHVLSESEGALLAGYLQQRGNLYLESYYTWHYASKTILHPMLKYTSKKIPVYYYQNLIGIPATFTDSMSFTYSAPMNYAVFSLAPTDPAYSTLINNNTPPKNLEIVYHGDDYKTIGTMLDFSAMTGGSPPSTQTTLMQRYLEFFDLNIAGPYPLFHTGMTAVCKNQAITFTDDSFDNITTRSWEFKGGTPATSNEPNPSVRYDSSGKFDVKLTVSDGTRTKTILKEKYIQVDQCYGTHDLSPATPLVRLFPNPASEQVTIEINHDISGNCEIMLFDLAGCKLKEIQQTIPAGNRLVMNLSGIGKGIYFLRVHTGELKSTVKLVKN